MSYRVFRVEHRTCMVCGHDQRCRIRIIDGMEQTVICHSCLGEGPWMSMPKLIEPPPPAPVNRFLAGLAAGLNQPPKRSQP